MKNYENQWKSMEIHENQLNPFISPLFLPGERALAVKDQKIAFPHTEFNGDRIKKTYYFSIPLYLPLCRPL